MLAQGSLRFILPPIFLGLILIYFEIYLLSILFAGISLYMAWFFRDPHRNINLDNKVLYAAADGQIKEIYNADGNLKIAIRMSPFNVHLNRSPYQGTVKEIKHKPGSHRTVYFAGAEEKNEQNLIKVESDVLTTDILQITGAFARRIECWVQENEKIDQGQKIGIIRFGSQTNMLFKPKNQDNLQIVPLVKLEQNVQAGITPVAKIRSLLNE